MSVEIHSVQDLVRIIREHPEWRRELVVALLGDEFLQIPERLAHVEEVLARLVESHERLAGSHERLAESHARLTERVDRLTESHEQLRESHERLTESHIRLAESHERLIEEVRELRAIVEQLLFRMARAESDIGHLRGEVLEIRYQQRAPAIFGYYVRRPRVLNVGHFLDELREQGQEFTHEEWLQLAAIDLLLSARHPQTREPLYLVVEVSRMIYPDAVERALERAEMLRQRGLSAYPAVAGEGIEPEAREMAERSRIFVLLNGVAIANGIRF
jgi:archaellum component FlaC